MITPIKVFNKLSPEAKRKVEFIEKRLYQITCEKILIDGQLRELDKCRDIII